MTDLRIAEMPLRCVDHVEIEQQGMSSGAEAAIVIGSIAGGALITAAVVGIAIFANSYSERAHGPTDERRSGGPTPGIDAERGASLPLEAIPTLCMNMICMIRIYA